MANIMGLSSTVENLRNANTAMRVNAEINAHNANGFSIIGINVNKIPEMKDAIDAYVESIKAKLEQIEADFDPNVAFRGTDIQGALKSYMSEAKSISLNIVTYLLAFRNQLDKIQAAYVKNDSDNSLSINDRRSSLQSSYSDAYGSNTGNTNSSYAEDATIVSATESNGGTGTPLRFN